MNDILPIDLSGFVTAPWGKSLLIKGNPGAGKTTLALEIIEKILSPENTVYLSTRVGDKAIYSQFPWVKELDEMSMRKNTGKKFLIILDPRAPARENEKNSREKRVLRPSGKEGTDGIVTDNLDSLGMDYPDLQNYELFPLEIHYCPVITYSQPVSLISNKFPDLAMRDSSLKHKQ